MVQQPASHRLAYALIFITPALWCVNYLVARWSPGVVAPNTLAFGRWLVAALLLGAFTAPELWRQRALLRAQWQRFVVLYILSGLAGTLLGTLLGDMVSLHISVGASGCLFGLLGAGAMLGFRDFGLPSALVQELRKASLINLGLNVVASLRPNVDWLAHLGGGLCGALLMLIVIRPKLDEDKTRGDQVFTALAVLCLFALLASVVVAIWQGQPWQPPPVDLSSPSMPQ